jgi:hypothetical protein
MSVRLPQPALPAVEHRRPFAWWHIARVSPFREMAGGSLVRHIPKQEGCVNYLLLFFPVPS